MSSISWLQWFPAFERSQKGITECHNLIMHFRVSLRVLSLLEILHPHYDLSLCLSLSFSAISFSQHSFFLFSFPTPPPSLFAYHIYRVFNFTPCFNTSALPSPAALIHSSSASLFHGQVAEQLAHYIRVSEMVITEELFDAAMEFGTAQGGPRPAPSRMT